MKKLLMAALVVLPLGLTASAGAKEFRELKVCGPAACRSIADRVAIEAIIADTSASTAPAAASDYYTVSYVVGEGAQALGPDYFVPASRMLRRGGRRGSWEKLGDDSLATLAAVTAGLPRFPRPALARATVGGKRVLAEPSSYLELYRIGTPVFGVPLDGDWLMIKLSSAAPSPWTDGASTLRYQPRRRLLWRDAQFVRLPKAQASRLMRRAPLR